jgi:hypothetical protein
MVQVVKHLPSDCKALSSHPSTPPTHTKSLSFSEQGTQNIQVAYQGHRGTII